MKKIRNNLYAINVFTIHFDDYKFRDVDYKIVLYIFIM